jgi:hypothetical protein
MRRDGLAVARYTGVRVAEHFETPLIVTTRRRCVLDGRLRLQLLDPGAGRIVRTAEAGEDRERSITIRPGEAAYADIVTTADGTADEPSSPYLRVILPGGGGGTVVPLQQATEIRLRGANPRFAVTGWQRWME